MVMMMMGWGPHPPLLLKRRKRGERCASIHYTKKEVASQLLGRRKEVCFGCDAVMMVMENSG